MEDITGRIFSKSKCCQVKCDTAGNTTKYYVCTKCGKSCDTDGIIDEF